MVVNLASQWQHAFFVSCPYKPSSNVHNAILYSILLSCFFVGSVYVMVPGKVRQLSRDNALHIKYRLMASFTIASIAVIAYPSIVCSNEESYGIYSSPAYQKLGFTWNTSVLLRSSLHTIILYLGSIVANLLLMYSIIHFEGDTNRRSRDASILYAEFKELCIDPAIYPVWPQIRNIWIAPIVEEVVFRGCMIGPMDASISNKSLIIWIVPLFFGVAHIHHAYLRLQQGFPWRSIVFSTTFQFIYTTLFGVYATYLFVRTNSLPAVIIPHQLCNYMGLPDLSFFQTRFGRLSILYPYRWIIMTFYLIGITGFIVGFSILLP
jgi:prenyl protein peptidase